MTYTSGGKSGHRESLSTRAAVEPSDRCAAAVCVLTRVQDWLPWPVRTARYGTESNVCGQAAARVAGARTSGRDSQTTHTPSFSHLLCSRAAARGRQGFCCVYSVGRPPDRPAEDSQQHSRIQVTPPSTQTSGVPNSSTPRPWWGGQLSHLAHTDLAAPENTGWRCREHDWQNSNTEMEESVLWGVCVQRREGVLGGGGGCDDGQWLNVTPLRLRPWAS